MVARGDKTRSKSPCLNVRVELDNRALKAKNTSLIQTVAKLQQDNAELIKQINLLQGESFDVNSRYNNLKNVISIIDSTTKTCLPKLNEVVETFTGIIQLCSVAANISNFTEMTTSANKDTRTQAVKPQIVNGHILHNPTITLSRMSNNISHTPPRSSRSPNRAIPSTSNDSSENNEDIDGFLDRDRGEDSDSHSDHENTDDVNEVQESSFVCRASRCSRKKQSDGNMDMSRFQDDFDDSDEGNEEPLEEEEENEEDQSQKRLKTIHEVEEEEEELLNSVSPRSRQRRFMQGRFQEVRIYLNQLPNTYIEQFRGPGNISISVSPPERRSSFQHRSSSLVGDANESVMDNGRLYLDEQLNCSRMSKGEPNFDESPRFNQNRAVLNASLQSPFRESSNGSNNLSEQFTETISAINSLQTPSTSTVIHNQTNSVQSDTLQELDLLHIQLQHKTSTPIVSRLSGETFTNCSEMYDSPNRSKNDSLAFKTNITKRKTVSREKRKVAKVLLNRLSMEKRLSGSPIKGMEDIVNVPLIRKSSDLKKGPKNGTKSPNVNSDEENVDKRMRGNGKGKRRKKDSPTKQVGDGLVKPKMKVSPRKSSGDRPKRAARPKTLKEPNLNKKLRRSK